MSGSATVPVNWNIVIFYHILRYLRMLYTVWSLVRRRLTRRLARLQSMCNVLKYCIKRLNIHVCGPVAFALRQVDCKRNIMGFDRYICLAVALSLSWAVLLITTVLSSQSLYGQPVSNVPHARWFIGPPSLHYSLYRDRGSAPKDWLLLQLRNE